MFLPGLAVVFAGITGQADHRVDHQLRALTADLHVMPAKLSAAELAIVGHHGEGAREVVARMHADGVIAGEYLLSGGHATVRLIIYNADGGLRSLSEMPLTARVLSADDLTTIRSNLADEVTDLAPAVAKPAVVAQAQATAQPARPIVDEDDAPPGLAPAPARIATKPETSAATVRRKHEPAPPPPAAEPTPDPSSDAAPAADATPESGGDSVNIAELEALTAGGSDGATTVDAAAAPAVTDGALHLRAAAGLGIASRSFTPGPTTVPAYTSSGVGVVRIAASIEPTDKISLSGLAERTLGMTTPVDTQVDATSFSRWELTGDYALVRGTVDLMPEIGVGHRAFTLASTDPRSSPSTEYSYAVLGARARAALGSRVTLHAHFALEPVLGGTDPMEMEFGSATRWAIGTGAAVEVRAWSHVFARIAADYQRFSWSWDQSGGRGAGGAVDGYPSGTISLGADY